MIECVANELGIDNLDQECVEELEASIRHEIASVIHKCLINFLKCKLFARHIEQIKMHQNANMQNMNEYGLTSCSEINPTAFEYIRVKIEKWKQIYQTADNSNKIKKVWEDKWYKMSLVLEPRKRG